MLIGISVAPTSEVLVATTWELLKVKLQKILLLCDHFHDFHNKFYEDNFSQVFWLSHTRIFSFFPKPL
jgi:hypothetical protein